MYLLEGSYLFEHTKSAPGTNFGSKEDYTSYQHCQVRQMNRQVDQLGLNGTKNIFACHWWVLFDMMLWMPALRQFTYVASRVVATATQMVQVEPYFWQGLLLPRSGQLPSVLLFSLNRWDAGQCCIRNPPWTPQLCTVQRYWKPNRSNQYQRVLRKAQVLLVHRNPAQTLIRLPPASHYRSICLISCVHVNHRSWSSLISPSQ